MAAQCLIVRLFCIYKETTMKPKASVWFNYFYDIKTPEEQIDAFLRGGFTESEFSDEAGAVLISRGNPEKVGKEFLAYAKGRGFSFPQGHLWIHFDITAGQEQIDIMKRWIDLYSTLEIKNAVLHAAGGETLSKEDRFERRVKGLTQLADYINGSDMTICVENLTKDTAPNTADDIISLIDAAGGKNLGICLDTGHLNYASVKGYGQSQDEFIRKAGKRLRALHISTNDGSCDAHWAPYCSRAWKNDVDWNEVLTALHDIGYEHLFNMELPGESAGLTLELLEQKLKYLRSVCDYMITRI